jgi:hypothetical protein
MRVGRHIHAPMVPWSARPKLRSKFGSVRNESVTRPHAVAEQMVNGPRQPHPMVTFGVDRWEA